MVLARFQLVFANALLVAVALTGCGDNNNSPVVAADSVSAFDGTYRIQLMPNRIDCFGGDGQVQIANGTVSGQILIGDRQLALVGSVALAGRDADVSLSTAGAGERYSLNLHGSGIRSSNGVGLTGNYSDSGECSGAWSSSEFTAP